LGTVAEPLVKLPAADARLRLPKPARASEPAPLLEGVEAPAADARPAVSDLRAVNLNPREAAVFGLLDAREARGIDLLIARSGLQAHEVLATLLVLEVRRLCRQLPGKRFLKA
jgi:DNA processing protein